MTIDDKLINDIDALSESIFVDWQDVRRLNLTSDQRKFIQQRVESCIVELNGLLKRLGTRDEPNSATGNVINFMLSGKRSIESGPT